MKLNTKTGMVVGISLIAMFLLAIFTLMGLDSKIIVPGDPETTANNISAFRSTFYLGIGGYLIILFLDVIVSLGFYVILKPVNKTYALVAAIFRLVYTAIALISLTGLALYFSDFYVNGLLVAYSFFILHLLILGMLVLKSAYVPKFFGVLLVAAAPFYILMVYGDLFLPEDLYNTLNSIVMAPAVLAELSLAVWLSIKSKRIPDRVKAYST